MYISRRTREMELSGGALSCVVKDIEGYNDVHSHEFYEFEFILSGKGSYVVDGCEYEILPGTLFFMSPASFHKVDFTEKTTLINIMFESDMCDIRLLYALFSKRAHIWQCVDGENFDFLKTVCTELSECVKAKKNPIYIRSLLDCVIAKVLSVSDDCDVDTGFDAMQRALIYIHSNYTEQITLEDTALLTGYSCSYFSEKFRDYVGVPFREYVLSLRFERVKKLLLYTDFTVTEICYECGFNNYSHFMRSFKNRYKTTPIAFRDGRDKINIQSD